MGIKKLLDRIRKFFTRKTEPVEAPQRVIEVQVPPVGNLSGEMLAMTTADVTNEAIRNVIATLEKQRANDKVKEKKLKAIIKQGHKQEIINKRTKSIRIKKKTYKKHKALGMEYYRILRG